MIKAKKILLGTLATTAMVATPIATVVSCGSPSTPEQIVIWGTTDLNTGLSMNYKVLTDKQSNGIGKSGGAENKSLEALMQKDSNEKWMFKDFEDISWKDVQSYGEVTINVTLSDYIKEKLIADMKSKGNPKETEIYLNLATQNIPGDVEFFDTTKDNSNKENSKKIANQIDDLVKKNNFKLKFNLILPKWLETDFHGKKLWLSFIGPTYSSSDKIKREATEKVSEIKYEDGMNTGLLESLSIEGHLTDNRFGASADESIFLNWKTLPQGLKKLDLSDNNLISFDATKLPQGLERLYLANNNLTSFDATKLPQGLKRLNLADNNLISFDTTHLPQGLEELNLNHNALKSFDTTHLPQGLEELNLWTKKLPQSEKDKITKWWKDHGKDLNDLSLYKIR